MQSYDTNCSINEVNKIGPLVLSLIAIIWLVLLHSTSFAATPWRTEIDATKPDFPQEQLLGEVQVGFTYVVPPSLVRQAHEARQTESGYEWTLNGTELSIWQTQSTPQDARYLLNWRFEYEGRILHGQGRTGFIFGNPDNANLLSVEMTRGGSLRLLSWGEDARGRVGRIAWSKQVRRSGDAPVRIEADYDIGQDTLVCRVDGGEPIRIKLGDYMPSGPMTIKAVGFFAAVPEAAFISRTGSRLLPLEYEIELSNKRTRVEHRRLQVSGQ